MKLSILLSSAVVILGAVSASARLGQYGSADVSASLPDQCMQTSRSCIYLYPLKLLNPYPVHRSSRRTATPAAARGTPRTPPAAGDRSSTSASGAPGAPSWSAAGPAGHRCKGGVCVPSCDRRDRPWCDRGDPGAVCCGFSWSDCQSQCSRDETEESGGFLTENWASFGTD